MRLARRYGAFLGLALVLVLAAALAPARADTNQTQSLVVSKCGGQVLTAGTYQYDTINTQGQKCLAVGLQQVGSNNHSGTVAAGGAFQVLLTQNPLRQGCIIVNPPTATETLYVFTGAGSPTTAQAIPLVAGAPFYCQNGGVVITDQISIESATTGHAFVERDQ